jgi:cytosine/uracil/thiamine/allantoin permease
MDTELYLIVGFFLFFCFQWIVILFMQKKITRLESIIRAIRYEAEDALECFGIPRDDDLTAIGEYAGDDNAGQLFTEEK